MMQPKSWWTSIVAAAFALLCAAANAGAEGPQLIASASGSCAWGSDDRGSGVPEPKFPAQPGNYPASLLRITVDGVSGRAGITSGVWGRFSAEDVTAGEVLWTTIDPTEAGTTWGGMVWCASQRGVAASATFDWFTIPVAPASFAGTARAEHSSQVAFTPPQAGQYRVSVGVSQGAVEVYGLGGSKFDVVSSATRDINVVDSSKPYEMTLVGLDGPPARWSLDVVPLPVAVADFAVSPRAARQGAVLTIGYALSGQATISARVLDPGNEPVRLLADSLSVKTGKHSLRWDGIDASGREVRSGVYSIELVVSDATGQTQIKTAQVTLDNTPPAITLPAKRKIGPKRAIVAKVADGLAGIKKATLIINGRQVARAGPDGKIIYRPSAGWPRKTRLHARVTATDRLGNTATRAKTLRVR